MQLELGEKIYKKHNSIEWVDELDWEEISLPQGQFDFRPFYTKERRSNYFPFWVKIEKIN